MPFAFLYAVMKITKNILGITLFILFVWANANANSLHTAHLKGTNLDKNNTTLTVDVYVTNGFLYADFTQPQSEKIHVEVFDITGNRAENFWLPANQDLHREMVLTKHLKRGLYIVKITAGKEVSAIKLRI